MTIVSGGRVIKCAKIKIKKNLSQFGPIFAMHSEIMPNFNYVNTEIGLWCLLKLGPKLSSISRKK